MKITKKFVTETLENDPSMKEALESWANTHGDDWRESLSFYWQKGADWNEPGLRRARNTFGYEGLKFI